MQHTGFDRIGTDVAEAEFDLLGNEIVRYRVNAKYAMGVLRGERGDRRHRIAAHTGDGFDVALNARPAAGIGAGDDEDATVSGGSWIVDRGGCFRDLVHETISIHDSRFTNGTCNRIRC
jgi:hypothetical protein